MTDKDDKEKRRTEKQIVKNTEFSIELSQLIEQFIIEKIGRTCPFAVMTRPGGDMLYSSNLSRDRGLEMLNAYVAEIEKSEPYDGDNTQVYIHEMNDDEKAAANETAQASVSQEIEKLRHQLDANLTKIAGQRCGYALVVVAGGTAPTIAANLSKDELEILFRICAEVTADVKSDE